ncbi:TraB/GumN family protein [Paucibacter sp. KCTC 42545]|uniref:TraB/GumN family protein n=1 Tax=Paucibacter sp. KCTC 42545 TaxID=1768242 RepID=UPI0018D21AB3|nr:TraB/GumN family protein [Paucibacter sp. KCTC 42545]
MKQDESKVNSFLSWALTFVFEIVVLILLAACLVTSCSAQTVHLLRSENGAGYLVLSTHGAAPKFKLPSSWISAISESERLCIEMQQPSSARQAKDVYSRLARKSIAAEQASNTNTPRRREIRANLIAKLIQAIGAKPAAAKEFELFSDYYLADAVLSTTPIGPLGISPDQQLVDAKPWADLCFLEDYEAAMSFGTKLNPAEALTYLRHAHHVLSSHDFKNTLDLHAARSIDAWVAQDISGLCSLESEYSRSNGIEAVQKNTITARNKNLARAILRELRSAHSTLFLVGAHHECGDRDSLTSELQRIGVQVTVYEGATEIQ